jgi:hypothetical protein
MEAIFLKSYNKSNGKTIFIYSLTGTDEELIDYKSSAGVNYRTEENKPLFYTQYYLGKYDSLKKHTKKGHYFPLNQEFLEIKCITEKYGGNCYKILYDQFKDKNWLLTEKNIKLNEAGQIKPLDHENDKDNEDSKKNTRDNYKGSYAQDVEDYSDQDIDDIFDGDPDMYWNID